MSDLKSRKDMSQQGKTLSVVKMVKMLTLPLIIYLSYLLSMTLMMFAVSHIVIKTGTSLSRLGYHDHFIEALYCLHLEN